MNRIVTLPNCDVTVNLEKVNAVYDRSILMDGGLVQTGLLDAQMVGRLLKAYFLSIENERRNGEGCHVTNNL